MNIDVMQRSIRLLIAEADDAAMREMYDYLEPLGYDLDSARNGNAAWRQVAEGSYDALVIDVMLPGMDGLELCRKLREEAYSDVPIIMLTDSSSLENRVLCLNWGADDFVTRPVVMLELEARIRALVRRARTHQASRVLQWSNLQLDPRKHEGACGGTPLALRPKGFAILAMLMRAAPGIVSREEMEHQLYGDNPPESDSLRVHLHLLRRELERVAGPVIKTVPRMGFMLEER